MGISFLNYSLGIYTKNDLGGLCITFFRYHSIILCIYCNCSENVTDSLHLHVTYVLCTEYQFFPFAQATFQCEVPYLFTYKPTLAISRDPKLVRHDSGSKILEKNRKNIGYKPRPKFLNKKLLERLFKKPSLSGNMSKVIVYNKITPFRNNEKRFISCKQLANQCKTLCS